jgi:hypothetical protein
MPIEPPIGTTDPGPDALFGKTDNPNASAISGINKGNTAEGFIAGKNPFHNEAVGVFGRSDKYGVLGVANKPDGIGVFGTSVAGAGIAIHGSATPGALAGKFVGNVDVTGGRLTVEGQDLLVLIQQIQQIVGPGKQTGMTQFGQPIQVPTSRPTLTISNMTHGGPGPQQIFLEGHGFKPGAVRLHIFHTVPGLGEEELFGPPLVLSAPNGDHLTVVGTDNTKDPNDLTGVLWSVPLPIDIS